MGPPTRADGRIHVTARRGGRTAPKGIVLHTTTRPDSAVHCGVPVTGVMRTLADLASEIDRPALARAVDAAEAQRLLDAGNLPEHGRAEAIFLDLCRRSGLPRPRTNHRIGTHEVDAVWLERRLVVECDGYAYHGTRQAFERD